MIRELHLNVCFFWPGSYKIANAQMAWTAGVDNISISSNPWSTQIR